MSIFTSVIKKVAKEKIKNKKPTQSLFKDDFESKLEEGQAPSKGTLDVESGKAGKVTVGSKSMPTFQEAASFGSRKRAKLVAKLETLEEKDKITSKQKTLLDKLNNLSKESDISRTKKASKTKRDEKSKEKGVSLAGQEGIIKAKSKVKLKDSDMIVGNTKNGITKDGEIIGNPTDNQIAIVIRNLDARQALSSAAKKNLAKLKRLSKKEKQDIALRKMERRLKDTGPDKTNKDFRKGGMFNKKSYARGGIARKYGSIDNLKGKK